MEKSLKVCFKHTALHVWLFFFLRDVYITYKFLLLYLRVYIIAVVHVHITDHNLPFFMERLWFEYIIVKLVVNPTIV